MGGRRNAATLDLWASLAPVNAMPESPQVVYSWDFWAEENTKYLRPHLRMRKVARLVNHLAAGREVRLLDVGCGPATLERLLAPNIRYYGIDIAIREPAANLKQSDILQEPIASSAAPFDLVVAEGLFEYLADQQSRKFAEIAGLLTLSGQIRRLLCELRSPSAELLLAL